MSAPWTFLGVEGWGASNSVDWYPTKYHFGHLTPEWIMQFCTVALTFESVDKILCCNQSMKPLNLYFHMVLLLVFQNFTKWNLGFFIEFCLWPHLAVKGLKLFQSEEWPTAIFSQQYTYVMKKKGLGIHKMNNKIFIRMMFLKESPFFTPVKIIVCAK